MAASLPTCPCGKKVIGVVRGNSSITLVHQQVGDVVFGCTRSTLPVKEKKA